MTETWLENYTYDKIQIGQSAEVTRTITHELIKMFAITSGDTNPLHLDERYADTTLFHGVIAPGFLAAGLISTVLGIKLPGPGTVYLGQDIRFLKPVRPDDMITVKVTVLAKEENHHKVTLECLATNQYGKTVISGTAYVMAPTESIRCLAADLPEVAFFRHDRMALLINKAKKLKPLRTAVVHPCDAVSLEGALAAAAEGLIIPILVGPESRIRTVADSARLSLASCEIMDVPHSHAAVTESVKMAHNGIVDALMKGSLHTDELMSGVLGKENGLRTDRRASHTFVMDVPTYDDFLLITDAALNIMPTLMEKRDICQNAINLAHDIGIEKPLVAILAATENVNVSMPATIDAATLCKMAERGQITGALLDGPLAFDNAISEESVRIKGISSQVAGKADILVVQNIESGNMLVKQLVHLSSAQCAGVVCGLKVPVTLTSRADVKASRMASAALAVLSKAGESARVADKSAKMGY